MKERDTTNDGTVSFLQKSVQGISSLFNANGTLDFKIGAFFAFLQIRILQYAGIRWDTCFGFMYVSVLDHELQAIYAYMCWCWGHKLC